MHPDSSIRYRGGRESSKSHGDNQTNFNQNMDSGSREAPETGPDRDGEPNSSATSSRDKLVESSHKPPASSSSIESRGHHHEAQCKTIRKTASGSDLRNQTAGTESTQPQEQQLHLHGVDRCDVNNNHIINPARRSLQKKIGGRTYRRRSVECERVTARDHNVEIERTDDDHGAKDVQTDSELDCDQLLADCLRVQLNAHIAGQSSGSASDADTIHSDHQNSTGYNADESLSAHCIDSDDKSSSTISLFGSSDKPILLRPRMRATFVPSSATGKLVQDSDKLDSGSECELCTCARVVQDQKFVNGCQSAWQSRSGRISRDCVGSEKRGGQNCLRCDLHHNRNHPLGERPRKFSLSSQSKSSQKSAKCSESTAWSSIFLWVPQLLRTGSSEQNDKATSRTRRRKSRRLSGVELKKFRLGSKLADELHHQEQQHQQQQQQQPQQQRPKDGQARKSVEWPKQLPISVIGDELDQSSDMPNNPDYGTGSRYQQALASGSRRISISRRSRLHESNGYLRLGNSYHRKQSEHSFFQELKRLILLIIIVGVCAVVLWQIYLVLTQETNFLGIAENSQSVLGKYERFSVSTDAEPCAKIGKKLLANGGHAIDAALGTLICMGLALPNSLGLGGGCLMTIYMNTTKTGYVIDGREVAPAYATPDMFAQNQLSASRGPLSVGVPGELAAYWEAHQRFGRLPWAMLFEDSIKMAEEGFPTVEHLSDAFRNKNHAQYIQPELKKIYTNNETGEYYKTGEIMRLPLLAETLKRIRDNGVKEFYEGQTGQLFIEDLQKQGGKMTMEDLGKYKANVKPSMKIELADDLTVHTQPIPGSGLVLSIILRIMKELGYYKNPHPKHSFESAALYYHHLVESFKFAYAQRAALEDLPDDPARIEALLAKITSDSFIQDAVKKIDDSTTLPLEAYGGLEYFNDDHGTAHVSVIDGEGNSIAITTSVNLYFGSGLISPRTGIIYNDIMDDFTSPNNTNKFGLLPSKYNRIKPGRRPISSMAPSVFVDALKNPKLILGASGGSQITTAIAIVSLRHIFFDEDIKTAIDGPRLHHQFPSKSVLHESNFPHEILSGLRSRNHGVEPITGRSSVVMAVACNYTASGMKRITANSDYRKGGSVAGL